MRSHIGGSGLTESHILQIGHGVNSLGIHHQASQVAQGVTKYHPAEDIQFINRSRVTIGPYLSCSIDKGFPFDFWQKIFDEVRVIFGFSNLNLDVFENQWKVVGVAVFDVACEQVMSYEANH